MFLHAHIVVGCRFNGEDAFIIQLHKGEATLHTHTFVLIVLISLSGLFTDIIISYDTNQSYYST